jgi:hypothetical protein
MGVPDIYKVSRIAEGRSIQRAITASALATIRKSTPERVLRQTWPRDEGAALLLKAAQHPTSTTDSRSAALRLFDIKVPRAASVPPKPVFV